jgi:hypothetical protein
MSATSTIASKPKHCRVGPYFTPQPAFSPSKKTTTEVDEEDMAGVRVLGVRRPEERRMCVSTFVLWIQRYRDAKVGVGFGVRVSVGF